MTGIPACTSVLAFREIFALTGVRRLGLVTPYTDDVQARIVETWRAAGIVCAAERHLGLQDNFSFADVDETRIAGLVRDMARKDCEAIAIVCTNMRGARLAETLERELHVPVYDSIATTLWKNLLVAGVDPSAVHRWGSLFSLHPNKQDKTVA